MYAKLSALPVASSSASCTLASWNDLRGEDPLEKCSTIVEEMLIKMCVWEDSQKPIQLVQQEASIQRGGAINKKSRHAYEASGLRGLKSPFADNPSMFLCQRLRTACWSEVFKQNTKRMSETNTKNDKHACLEVGIRPQKTFQTIFSKLFFSY